MKLLAALILGCLLVLDAGAATAQTQLRLGLLTEPKSLDPTIDASVATRDISYQNIFEGLTRFNAEGAIEPDLAQSWEISADKLTYTFHLRPDVRFQDGTTLDARQVVFTFERLLKPDSGTVDNRFRDLVAKVASADPMTVTVALKQADESFLEVLAGSGAVIIAPESVDSNATEPIGTGPFAFVQWAPGDSLLLERNEDFWGHHPDLTQVIVSFLPDAQAALNAIQAGDVDALPHFPKAEAPDLLKSSPQFSVIENDAAGELAIWNARLAGYRRNPASDTMVLDGISWKE